MGITIFIFSFAPLRILNIKKCIDTMRNLKKLLGMVNADIVHTESSRSIVYLKWALSKQRIPLVWHVRVSNAEPFFYEWFLYRSATSIIAVSNAVKKRFSFFSNVDKKINVIYNAVDMSCIAEDHVALSFRDEMQAHNVILVGIVGEVTPLKGHMNLIRAAARVVSINSHIKFVIVGAEDEGFKDLILREAQLLGVNEYICFLGFREDITRIMKDLDILVCASAAEGFSRVIIEAMSLSKVVIATDVGGNPEAIEDGKTGLLVSPDSPEELADAIVTLISDQSLRELMGHNGRERVQGLFDLNTQVYHVEKVYSNIFNVEED
jgi:glycosyltransferase involved in cell wall biosynthesis